MEQINMKLPRIVGRETRSMSMWPFSMCWIPNCTRWYCWSRMIYFATKFRFLLKSAIYLPPKFFKTITIKKRLKIPNFLFVLLHQQRLFVAQIPAKQNNSSVISSKKFIQYLTSFVFSFSRSPVHIFWRSFPRLLLRFHHYLLKTTTHQHLLVHTDPLWRKNISPGAHKLILRSSAKIWWISPAYFHECWNLTESLIMLKIITYEFRP